MIPSDCSTCIASRRGVIGTPVIATRSRLRDDRPRGDPLLE